jgi:hypothetical protein
MIQGILFVTPAVIFDAVVGGFLVIGLYRSSRIYRTKMPLVKLIMRDGLLYFAVVFATNITWLVVHIIRTNNWQRTSRIPLEARLFILSIFVTIVDCFHVIGTSL